MAGQVVYAEVSSKRRVTFTSQAPDPDDSVMYAEVALQCQSDRAESTPEARHAASCVQNPHWCYLVLTLYFTALILLLTAILLAVKCPRP